MITDCCINEKKWIFAYYTIFLFHELISFFVHCPGYFMKKKDSNFLFHGFVLEMKKKKIRNKKFKIIKNLVPIKIFWFFFIGYHRLLHLPLLLQTRPYSQEINLKRFNYSLILHTSDIKTSSFITHSIYIQNKFYYLFVIFEL